MRSFRVVHPRVHVVCNVSGSPGPCSNAAATTYTGRVAHQSLMLRHLVPRFWRAWFALIDLDEFLTPVYGSLLEVLANFSQWGASLVHVNELVYGPNGVKANPTCATLVTFRRPARRGCKLHRQFKTLFRAHGNRPLLASTRAQAHIQVVEEHHWFSADGVNVSRCIATGTCKSCQSCPANGSAPSAKLLEKPLLVLRHYLTRSSEEWFAKTSRFREYNLTQYASRYGQRESHRLHDRMNGDDAKVNECRPFDRELPIAGYLQLPTGPRGHPPVPLKSS
jgi:hypothetical protein